MGRIGIKDMEKCYEIQTNVRRWGNSQGIRLTRDLLAQMDLHEDDEILIKVYNGKMIIEKLNKPKYPNLKERLEAFYQKPIEEIYIESTLEVDVGKPKGHEIC